MIGSVGGTLGIFTGFSISNMITYLINKLPRLIDMVKTKFKPSSLDKNSNGDRLYQLEYLLSLETRIEEIEKSLNMNKLV